MLTRNTSNYNEWTHMYSMFGHLIGETIFNVLSYIRQIKKCILRRILKSYQQSDCEVSWIRRPWLDIDKDLRRFST